MLLMMLDKPIATGRTAEIYPWHDDLVLKLFHTWVSEDSVQYEARIARAVHAAGLAVPRVGEIVEVDGRLGLEYERFGGTPMGEIMPAKLWLLLRFARQLAELHVSIHKTPGVPGIPSQRKRLMGKIRTAKDLPVPLQEACVQALARMPEGDRLCHGDFHPLNVLLYQGRAAVIDWVDATYGNPLADVARTAVIMRGVGSHVAGNKASMTTRIEVLALRWFTRIYLRRYFELRPGGEAEYQRWWPIVAAGRMNEGIPELSGWLRQQVEAKFNSERL
jgi:aminoglycoside phosphotransferase (APT) family kinase protein